MAERAHKTRQKLVFRLPTVKPRNPLIAPAHMRVAGAHRKSTGAVRADQKKALKRAIDDAKDEV